MSNTMERIHETGLVPVVVIDHIDTAVETAKALLAGGVDLMEITMRTEAGLGSIKLVAEECPEMLVGAGTVITLEQCKQAIAHGAKFIVSPGFDPEVVAYCNEKHIPVCPGCVTPTEITAAISAGIDVVKFFPADIYGGIKAIKALRGPFGKVRFIPTGGVGLKNLVDFIDPAVYAIGGGWLCDKKLINEGRFEEITEICKKSIDLVLGLKNQMEEDISLHQLMTEGGTVTTIHLARSISQLVRRGFVVTHKEQSKAVLERGDRMISLIEK